MVMRRCTSRRINPAAARIAAWTAPLSTLPSRVGTFPRSSATSRSGLRASSCERRRRLEVPTREPAGRSSRFSAPVCRLTTSASRGSSRSSCATISRPSTESVGRSFRECTAQSILFFASATSSSRVKRPFAPISLSGWSSFLSPVVLNVTISDAIPRSISALSTSRACRSASSEARVPILTTAGSISRLEGTEDR